MKVSRLVVPIVLCVGFATVASADPVTLTFQGLQNGESVNNYFNGGLGSLGSGPGPNYGIVASGLEVVSGLPLGVQIGYPAGQVSSPPSSATTSGLFNSFGEASAFIDVAGGFTNSISYNYQADGTTADIDGTVSVYSGLNGQGTLLGSTAINGTCTQTWYSSPYGFGGTYMDTCSGASADISFQGTAESIEISEGTFSFATSVTLDTAPPVAVTPEPGTLVLLGTGLLAFGFVLRKRVTHLT